MIQREKLNVESAECCVYAVIITTGEKYEFEKPGGRYNVVPHLLTGRLNDGTKFFLNLADKNIKEIRISTGQTISRVDLAKNPGQRISEIMVDGNISTFDQNGGRYETEAETIHGIVKSGDEIDVPMEDINHVKVKRVAADRISALVKVVIGTLLVAAIAIALAAEAPSSSHYSGPR
jgi:hypothetical protein